MNMNRLDSLRGQTYTLEVLEIHYKLDTWMVVSAGMWHLKRKGQLQ